MANATRCKLLAVILLLPAASMLFLVKSATAQQSRPALPLPEMQKLSKLYVGRWEYTETYPKSSMAPNGGTNAGVYTSELGPGGNSIFNHFHSKGPVGEFDGTLVITWDPQEKAYKAYAFGDSFPSALVENGQWEEDTLVFRSELSMGGSKVSLRNATKWLPDGKISSDEFSAVNGAPEKLVVHVEGVKRSPVTVGDKEAVSQYNHPKGKTTMSQQGRILGIGGIFFKSANQKEMKEWYAKHLGLGDGGHEAMLPWREKDNPESEQMTVWSIFPGNTKYFEPGPASFMVNYIVDDLDALLDRLAKEGVRIDPKRQDESYGRFAWIYDLDGNKIELWQPLH